MPTTSMSSNVKARGFTLSVSMMQRMLHLSHWTMTFVGLGPMRHTCVQQTMRWVHILFKSPWLETLQPRRLPRSQHTSSRTVPPRHGARSTCAKLFLTKDSRRMNCDASLHMMMSSLLQKPTISNSTTTWLPQKLVLLPSVQRPR